MWRWRTNTLLWKYALTQILHARIHTHARKQAPPQTNEQTRKRLPKSLGNLNRLMYLLIWQASFSKISRGSTDISRDFRHYTKDRKKKKNTTFCKQSSFRKNLLYWHSPNQTPTHTHTDTDIEREGEKKKERDKKIGIKRETEGKKERGLKEKRKVEREKREKEREK